ncbi:MAG: HEAT repeat domain-containing protein [Spirochaetales bacterium]|nr:HEAT repeat domain-containing protein [Spirochaetales bacterium]
MKVKTVLIPVLLFFICLSGLSADDAVSLTIIKKMAESPDPNQKLEAVQSLENMFARGLSDKDAAEALNILSFLSTEGLVNVKYDSLRVDNNHSQVRNEAVRVLGTTGREEAVEALVTVILNEPQTHVLSTAVISCGQLGMAGKRMNAAFYMILTGKKEAYRYDSLVYNTLLAVQEIMKKDDSLLISGVLREGVIYVARPDAGYLKKTRLLAEEILKKK